MQEENQGRIGRLGRSRELRKEREFRKNGRDEVPAV